MWTANADYIRIRLKTEIFNQGLGVAYGEKIEAELDSGIQRALEILATAASQPDRNPDRGGRGLGQLFAPGEAGTIGKKTTGMETSA